MPSMSASAAVGTSNGVFFPFVRDGTRTTTDYTGTKPSVHRVGLPQNLHAGIVGQLPHVVPRGDARRIAR